MLAIYTSQTGIQYIWSYSNINKNMSSSSSNSEEKNDDNIENLRSKLFEDLSYIIVLYFSIRSKTLLSSILSPFNWLVISIQYWIPFFFLFLLVLLSLHSYLSLLSLLLYLHLYCFCLFYFLNSSRSLSRASNARQMFGSGCTYWCI